MLSLAQRIADSDTFDRLTITIILINAAILGVDCNPILSENYSDVIFYTLWASQIYFVCEVAIRIAAHAPHFLKYFSSFWNRFDFIIVAISLVPAVGSFITVARIFRILRVLRMLTVSDRLRAFLIHTQRSFDEAAYFAAIWAVIFYVFAVSGFTLFSEIDPDRWGGLWKSFQTLALLSLLQEVPQTARALSQASISACAYLLVFFGSWLFLLINTVAAITAQHIESRVKENSADD